VRYNLFSVDYGAYIRFRGTVNEVSDDVFLDADKIKAGGHDCDFVPYDDRRSIRRIIFDPDAVEIVGAGDNYIPDDTDLPLWRIAES
ncbi:MAG: hypothetical protein IID40_05600, partial [Planctomycetes bacterium]|nr:hypothetical protein [Planctomycetota bacterium]